MAAYDWVYDLKHLSADWNLLQSNDYSDYGSTFTFFYLVKAKFM